MKYIIAAYLAAGVMTAANVDQLYRTAGWEPKIPGAYVGMVMVWPAIQVGIVGHSLRGETFLNLSVNE